jgi:shikimate kinase
MNKNNKKNIVLIGMPGAGKSTIGVVLAKALGFSFCDTDLIIQKQEKNTLQEIIGKNSIKKFLEKEKNIICSLDLKQHVIATGGSAVYHHETMSHLKKNGIIIYIDVTYKELKKRIADMKTRGIVIGRFQSFQDLFNERIPLYKKYAEITISSSKKNIEKIAEEIISVIK